MKKKNKEQELKDFIQMMFDKYAPILFIDKYHLTSRLSTKEEGYYLASRFNYPYLDITIIYSGDAIENLQKDPMKLKRQIIHEFCHVITDPFYSVCMGYSTKEQIENERERMVDHISQIINKHVV